MRNRDGFKEFSLLLFSNLSVNDGINSLRAMSENESEK